MIDYTWQDTASLVAVFIFCLSVVPTIWNQARSKSSTIPLTTSAQMVFAIGIIIPVFYSVGLLLGSVGLTIQLMLWLVVGAQRIIYGGPLGLTGDRKLRR